MEFVYQYDENGSLIRKTSRADGSYETYTWNHRGKMTSARGYTSGNELEWEEVYRYDALNRNITTIRNEDGSSETKHSVYDEAGLYSLLYELDGAQRVTMAAMHGPAVDMVLAEDRVDYSSGSAVHELNWLLGDHQNSATVVADGDGTDVPQIKSATVRSAFGKVVSQTGSSVDSAFGFQGQVEDEATGQGVFRNRNYSSQQGRFISQDPIRFASGQTNHYQFVANHPHMGTDPSGLAERIFASKADRQGYFHEYPVIPSGRNADFRQANAAAKLANKAIVGEKSVSAIWHHKDFNEKTGKMTMQLVDAAIHQANGHSGGYDKWIKWAAEQIGKGEDAIDALNDAQRAALRGIFNDGKTFDDVLKVLKAKGITAKVSKGVVQAVGETPIVNAKFFDKSGKEILDVAAPTNAKVLIKKATQRGGGFLRVFSFGSRKLLLPAVIIYSAGSAYANGGGSDEIVKVVGRDMVDADMIETGFQLTIVAGANIVADEFIDPQGYAAKRFAILEGDQKEFVMSEIERHISQRQTFAEIGEEATRDVLKGNLHWGLYDQKAKF